jgi:hypothetical protein
MEIPINSQITEEDIESIVQTCTDFIESWYSADAERMKNCFHKDAVKRSIVFDDNEMKWTVSPTRNGEDMAKFTADGGESDLPEDSKTMQIELLGAHRRTAVAKVISHSYVDFVQLGKFDDGWLIVNDLWEIRSEQ